MQFTKFMNKQIKSTQDGNFWSEQPKPIYRTKPQKKTPNILQIENRWFHLTDLNPMHEVSDLLWKRVLSKGPYLRDDEDVGDEKRGRKLKPSELGYSRWCLLLQPLFFTLLLVLFYLNNIIALCGPTTSGDAPSPQFFNLFSLPTRSNCPLFRHPFFIKINW